jgi:hypothetical protein
VYFSNKINLNWISFKSRSKSWCIFEINGGVGG